MTDAKILAFAGSARQGSYNKKLVKIAVEGAKAAGAEVTYIDFRDLPLPLYDEDLEAALGVPENALKLKGLMKAIGSAYQAFDENDNLKDEFQQAA